MTKTLYNETLLNSVILYAVNDKITDNTIEFFNNLTNDINKRYNKFGIKFSTVHIVDEFNEIFKNFDKVDKNPIEEIYCVHDSKFSNEGVYSLYFNQIINNDIDTSKKLGI